jgi:hypothetical protein
MNKPTFFLNNSLFFVMLDWQRIDFEEILSNTVLRVNSITPCNLCIQAELQENHPMIKRVMKCKSRSCKAIGSCRVQYKTLSCTRNQIPMQHWQAQEHLSVEISPKTQRGAPAHIKGIIDGFMTEHPNLKPNVIVRKLKVALNVNGLPPMTANEQKQTLNYTKNKMATDAVTVDDLRDKIAEKMKTEDDMSELLADDAFIKYLDDIGDGSAENPLLLFLTNKTMLLHVFQQVSEGAIMFHLDATHKLNKVGYNVFVGGISDRGARFYPAFIAICSNARQAVLFFVNYSNGKI